MRNDMRRSAGRGAFSSAIAPLDRLGAAHGVHGAWKLRHQAVTDAAELLALELLDEPVEEGRGEP